MRPAIAAGSLGALLGDVVPARALVVWGDLHAHSGFSSDAIGDPAAFYTRARDVVGLDFVVLSDHDVTLSDSEWVTLKQLAAAYNEPGRFVTFVALEWSQGYHMNVYFRGDDAEFCGGETRPPCPTTAGFVSFYGTSILNGDALAHINHPGLRVPWHEVSATRTPNAEMFNHWWNRLWGFFDSEVGFNKILWALRVGHRLGFVGVSDSHGYWWNGPVGTGLTGCHVSALTRDEILAALRERRCYATDGQRILVDFDVDGIPMGGELAAPIGSTVTATVDVLGTAVPAAIEIVRNGDVVAATTDCGSSSCAFSAPVSVQDEHTFIYARVRQPGGFRAWASPVWVRGQCTTPVACPVDRFVSGEPLSTRECLFRWRVRDASQRSGQLVTCVDGHPVCDAGGTPNECTFRVGICAGVRDGAPTCQSQPVTATALLRPTAEQAALNSVDDENRLTLLAALKVLGPTSPPGRCTPYVDVRVPLDRRTDGTFIPGIRSLTGEGANAFGEDRDLMRLRCLPSGS